MENKTIYAKLLEAKKEMEAITKDSKNPFFKSNYFDINKILSEVEPILQDKGLLLLQPIEAEFVKTQIFDIDSGEKISSEMQLPDLKDPQKLGSAITYYRRYTLQSLLGLQAEDDDGNNSKPLPKQEDNTPVVWINDNQIKKAIDSGKETIQKTLDYYDGKTIREDESTGNKFKACISKANKDKLTKLLSNGGN